MKALILVGGLGTRLRPLTDDTPKPMVLIDDKPFLEYQIDWLKKYGITEIVLLCGFKSEKIEEYFGDGSSFGVKISYSKEKEPLGTAGPIKLAKDFIDDTFLVVNGDTFFPVDLNKLVDFHREKNAEISIALALVDDTSRYGLVELGDNGKILRFAEKGEPIEGVNTINGGIYVLEPSVVEKISEGKVSIENDIFPKITALFGLPFDIYFIDIGTQETYQQFQDEFHKVVQ